MKRLIQFVQSNDKVWVFADQAVVSGSNFIVGVLLARLLGLAEYGSYSLLWMVVLFASSMQQSVVVAPLFSMSARQENKENWLQQLTGLQLWFALFTLFAVAVFLSIAHFFDVGFKVSRTFLWLPLVVLAFISNDFFRRMLFVKGKARKALMMDIIGYGIQPIALLAIHFWWQLTLESALISVALLQTLSTCLGVLFTKTKASNPSFEFLKSIWGYSKYLIGTAILQWFSGNYFLIAAGGLIGTSAVGAVKIAQNIMGVLHVLFLAMENSVPVTAAKFLEEKGIRRMMQYFKHNTLQMAVPLIVFVAIIALVRNQIIELLFDITSPVTAQVLLAFCGIYLLVFIGTQLRFIIRSVHKNQYIFWSYVLTTIFSVLSAKIMVEYFDVMGIVIGIALTHIISLSLFFYALKTELKWLLK